MKSVVLSCAAALSLMTTSALASQTGEATAPLTQTASNGSYWALTEGANDAPPYYTQIENLCLTTDGKRFFGIHPAAAGKPNFAVTEGGKLPIVLHPADVSEGKRQYRISNPEDAEEYLTMNFIDPAMRNAELPSATAGLSSISTGEEYEVDCVDDDKIVMLAAGNGQGFAVTLENSDLILRSLNSDTEKNVEFRGGLFSDDGTSSTFYFFDDTNRAVIELSATGKTDDGAILFEGADIRDSIQPEVYFLANPQLIGERSLRMDPAVANVIERLSTCNHFAGEPAEEAARKAQIAQRWSESRCDSLSADYTAALGSLDEGSRLHTYLEANSPAWE